jgi:hypothetical protein
VAQGRHKRETPPRFSRLRLPQPRVPQVRLAGKTPPRGVLVAAPLATLATLGVVGAGVFGADVPVTAPATLAGSTPVTVDLSDRAPVLSRSAERKLESGLQQRMDAQSPEVADDLAEAEEQAVTERVVQKAKRDGTKLWATTALNLWNASDQRAKQVGELDDGDHVLVTGRREHGRVEVVVDGQARWVTAGYFSDEKPAPADSAVGAAAGLSMAPCPNTSVESGLTTNAIRVYRSVCHAFPQITNYGGYSPRGEHASGRALDIMVTDVGLGTAIADYLRAHAAELHLYDVIWRQHIWTPVRAGEGWRLMSNRGSATANHYDHVHVSTY